MKSIKYILTALLIGTCGILVAASSPVYIINWTAQNIRVKIAETNRYVDYYCKCGSKETEFAKLSAGGMYHAIADERYQVTIADLHFIDASGNPISTAPIGDKNKIYAQQNENEFCGSDKSSYCKNANQESSPDMSFTTPGSGMTCGAVYVIWFDKGTKELKITGLKEWNMGKNAVEPEIKKLSRGLQRRR